MLRIRCCHISLNFADSSPCLTGSRFAFNFSDGEAGLRKSTSFSFFKSEAFSFAFAPLIAAVLFFLFSRTMHSFVLPTMLTMNFGSLHMCVRSNCPILGTRIEKNQKRIEFFWNLQGLGKGARAPLLIFRWWKLVICWITLLNLVYDFWIFNSTKIYNDNDVCQILRLLLDFLF